METNVKVLMETELEAQRELEVLQVFSKPEVKLLVTQPQMVWPPVRGASLAFVEHGGLMQMDEE